MQIRPPSAWRRGLVCSLLALGGFTSGCAFENPLAGGATAVAAGPPGPAANAPQDELLAFVVAAAPGQSGIVQDPLHGRTRVRLDREYFSADGLICRRFTLEPLNAQTSNAMETRAACREAGGWRVTAIGSTGAIPAGP